jgi:hypothetical protein
MSPFRRISWRWQGREPGHRAARFISRMTMSMVELNRVQRRVTVLFLVQDRHLPQPNQPPETYAEFLIRTSGPMLHESSAKSRLAGRQVG